MDKNNKYNNFNAVGFGIAVMDYICVVNNLANYYQSVPIVNFKFCGGGCVPTACVTLQRLGEKSAFIGFLGDDWMGKEIVRELKKEGINCSGIELRKECLSPFSFIQSNKKSGERAITYYQGIGRSLKLSKLSKELIRKGKILLIDGFTPEEDLKAKQFAHDNGLKVMLDASVMLGGTKYLLPYIDYLIVSEAFLFEYSKIKSIDYSIKKVYEELKPEVVVATLGKKGSVTVINNKVIYVDSFKVEVVDTTGAGDVYHGAFIFGILKGWNIKDIMIFSSAVSAIKCMSYGGRKGIPNFETTLDFLKKNKINTDKFE